LSLDAEPIRVLLDATQALERAGIVYALGGSVASTLHGLPRTTNDIDLAIFLPEPRVERAAAELDGAFFVDVEAARAASRRRSSFNIFHRATMLKVDLFVLAGDAFDREQMRRRVRLQVGADPSQTVAALAPEDLILRKLAWFRDGGGVSDRQWLDVLGVIKVQRGRLDLAYARSWARGLGVAELLERALALGTD
jgi:hypothetical protein